MDPVPAPAPAGGPTAYDAVAYTGFPYRQTHPTRLATLAHLHGLAPAPPDRCRYLELGCGDGGNLLPMAWEFPGSEFAGVDLASSAVARGRAEAEHLGLRNLDLRVADVMDLGPESGTFDYIVAHGLYSWVPPPVQDRVLSICRRNLSERGVAYVSYDALPGGHLRAIVRDMLRFHTGGIADPEERIRKGAWFLGFAASRRPSEDPFRRILMDHLENSTGRARESLFHDDMAPVHEPLYFQRFVERAARHGLQYLTEADWLETRISGLPPEAAADLRTVTGGDPILLEQYLDFLKVRRFRQTLLVPSEARFSREVLPERVRSLFVTSDLEPASPPADLAPGVEARFRLPESGAVELRDPVPKAALVLLHGSRPRPLAFGEILRGARDLVGRTGDAGSEEDARDLAELLLGAYGSGLLDLYAHRHPVASAPGERPKASPVARSRARSDHRVPNLLHGTVSLDDPACRALIHLLDGTRDREALLRDLSSGGPPGIGAPAIEDALRTLHRVALLLA